MQNSWKGVAAFAIIACATGTTGEANAATYIFQFSGQIDRQRAVNSQFDEIPVPDSLVKSGDKVRGSITFDAKRSASDHGSDGLKFYFTDGRDFSLEIGSGLKWASLPGQSVFNRIALGNDVTASGTPTDFFDLSTLIYGISPFENWSNNSAILFSFRIDDTTGKVYNSNAIEDPLSISNFAYPGTVSIGFNDNGSGGVGKIASMSVKNLQASLAVVPEPATWTMMLIGFAMVGGAARYRRRGEKVTYA